MGSRVAVELGLFLSSTCGMVPSCTSRLARITLEGDPLMDSFI